VAQLHMPEDLKLDHASESPGLNSDCWAPPRLGRRGGQVEAENLYF
jgi:hypothetical protein